MIGPTYICRVLCADAAPSDVDVVHEAGEAGVADALDAFGDGTTIISSCKGGMKLATKKPLPNIIWKLCYLPNPTTGKCWPPTPCCCCNCTPPFSMHGQEFRFPKLVGMCNLWGR